MKKFLLMLTLCSASAMASNAEIINALVKLGYKKAELKISNNPVKGLKTVSTPDGLLYITDDGKFLTQGPIYSLNGRQPENIANPNNAKLIKSIENDAIVYKAKNEKFIVSIFTDYTCHYCQELHKEINSYLDAGITVHYFAFPRAGVDSDVGVNMQYIWSAADRKAAFENAYKGNPITPATSVVLHVKQQFNVGRQIGISGTPAIVLPSGQLVSGYVPADELIKIIRRNQNKKN